MKKILIIDDDVTVCKSLTLFLQKKEYVVQAMHHPQIALEQLVAFKPDIVLLDMNFTIDTSGKQGLLLLKRILEQNPNQAVMLMTGWATVQLAVEGMKLGALDFMAKPWDNQHLLSSIQSVQSMVELKTVQEKQLGEDEIQTAIIGESALLKEVLATADRIADTNAPVLILGESGTGKELIAEYLHRQSRRRNKPFVKVNLGGISTSLFESEMFGHKKGSFTDAQTDRVGRFAMADSGTIFLDEIGELPMSHQVKLLRVLQEKTFEVLGSSVPLKVDFRLVCATNKDIGSMVYQGTFREDLFYRINLITLEVPALRKRQEDIPLLVMHFAKSTAKLYQSSLPKIEKSAIEWLSAQDFPGNIRQLKNLVERTILLNTDKKILGFKEFQLQLSLNASGSENSGVHLPAVGHMSLEDMEQEMIKKALAFHHHSISQTAAALGITRSSLYRRLEKYSIK